MATRGVFNIRLTGIRKGMAKSILFEGRVKRAIGAALYQEAEAIMADSKENYVPVVTGALRASGHVNPPVYAGSVVSVMLGYGNSSVRYAAKTHENPRSGKTGGVSPKGKPYAPGTWSRVGQWKFLELPIQKVLPVLPQRIAARMAVLLGLGRGR